MICDSQTARCGRTLWAYSVEPSTSGTQGQLDRSRSHTMTWTYRPRITRLCSHVNMMSDELITRVSGSACSVKLNPLTSAIRTVIKHLVSDPVKPSCVQFLTW